MAKENKPKKDTSKTKKPVPDFILENKPFMTAMLAAVNTPNPRLTKKKKK
ncbi:hypothetical protein [Flavivirga jejuensis]|uniref:Uncharacterized protein n=1 Tax=Flavivirga jejuensis TaxID=870487 RepID=A0ABT8WRB7_9FLAO|nr:hypothetical protein [Flavivirga jejuensis]MDO5975727.1 hypothetical protein [Flavivirga jejuensis]